MPVSQDAEQGWIRGLGYQEAPQAHGQEEAPQTAAQDARPAQEQEVATSQRGRAAVWTDERGHEERAPERGGKTAGQSAPEARGQHSERLWADHRRRRLRLAPDDRRRPGRRDRL